MLPLGTVHPDQLAMLTKVLQDFCQTSSIAPGSFAHDDARRLVMGLYERGFTSSDELTAALRSVRLNPR
jgi:hypothetical protein